MRLISVYVDEDITQFKQRTGVTWRGLIKRGMKSFDQQNDNQELKEKIAKMAQKLQDQAVKIYKLENKDDD